ncbi:hypothetical protein GCM10022215_42560 [Nocardioides fonticola]|uniref:WYL domain-containing protein n=1 Tax=Nocardioides fonticola TaxID=450363 RepID=A0ABP7Y304_9ACTN
MKPPLYVVRLARLPQVIDVLSSYPEGLALTALAEQFGTDAATLEQDLIAYLDLESWGWGHDIFRRPALEFVSGGEDDEDASDGIVVRVAGDVSPGLGVEHLDAGELAVVYTAGQALLDVEPDDADLSSALEVIAETMYGSSTAVEPARRWSAADLRLLQEAQENRQRVRIVYSRAWAAGVRERVIEPLRLVQTRRGWEVDAGPVGPEGNLRTYLLANVRAVEVLDETFEPPADVEQLLVRQRATSRVRLQLPQDARWVVDMYAESIETVAEDEDAFVADLDLLPPDGERVGLMLLASGPGARVISPGTVLPEAMNFVERLLGHHEAPLS